MSALTRALASPVVEARGILPGPWDGSALAVPAPGSTGQWSTAGQRVDEPSALGIVTLFAGIRIIADAVSTTPVRAVTVNGDGTRSPVAPSPDQVTSPFDGCTLQEGFSQLVTSLILRGNAYLYGTGWTFKAGKAIPSAMRILHPDQVSVAWGTDGQRSYKINNTLVDSWKMFHLTGFMLPNSPRGASIIEYCRNALGIGIALEDVAGQYFQNGLMTTGMVSTDMPLTDDQARQAAAQFQGRHAGSGRAFLPIVLGGGAKFTPISLSLQDAQFLQSRQFSANQMATLLGIPPHLLGIVDKTTSWGTGIEVQGRAFVDYALRSFYVRIGNLLTSILPDGMFADFITDAITRADTAIRYQNYAVALGSNNGVGWMCVDEVRAFEGMAPLPNGAGRTYFVPAASVPVGSSPTTSGAIGIPVTDPSTGAVGNDDAATGETTW